MSDGESDPLVAAIVATMDRPEYVREAIASACEQTYDPIEVVVVDGSDDDRTEAVVEELRGTYPDVPITYLRNETPQGLPAARNQAVPETDARYLAFLDDDDRWRPEKTSRQLSVFRSGPDDLGVVHSAYDARDDEGEYLYTFTPDYEPPVYRELLVRNAVTTPSSVVVRRDAFEDVDGFDESMRYCEDWDLYLRLSRHYGFEYLTDPLVDRTYHDESMIADLDTFLAYRKQLLEKYEDELRRHGLTDRAWAEHYELAGNRYLDAGRRAQARTAYRKAWARERDPEIALLSALLYAFPVGVAHPTIRFLGAIKRKASALPV